MAALAFTLLLGLGWLVPDHFPPWLAFHNEAPVFAGLILACAVTLWQRGATRAIEMPASLWLTLLLMLTGLVQYVLGLLSFSGDLWLSWLYLGGFAMAWWLGSTWADEPKTQGSVALETLLLAFSAGATLSALISLIQWFGQEPLWGAWVMSATHTPRAIANLAQPNQLSTLLLMGVVATAILYERQRVSGSLTLVLLTLQTAVLVLTQSRTGMLVVVLLVGVAWWSSRKFTKIRFRQILLWGMTFGVASWLYQTQGQEALKAALGSERIGQVGLRPLMWKQFVAALGESPWLGYGWLQTVKAQQEGALLVPGLEQATYAHNLLLDLAIWLGLPVALLVCAGALWFVWQRRAGLGDGRVVMGLVLLLPFASHAMLEFPHAYAYFLFPVAILSGMMDRWTRGEESRARHLPRPLAATIVLTYSVLAAAVGYEYLQAEEDFRVVRFESRNLGETPAEYAAPEFKLLDQFGAMLAAIRLKPRPGMPDAEIELLGRATQRYFWPALHFKYGLALGMNQKPEQATKHLQRIKGLFGEKVYAEIRAEFVRLRQEQHPELAAVQIP